MMLRQFFHSDPVAASYLFGCGGKASGAQYVLFEGAAADFPFKGVQDGDVLGLGNVVARVLHRRGQTRERICLVVTEQPRHGLC